MTTSFRNAGSYQGTRSPGRSKRTRTTTKTTAPGYKNVYDTFYRRITSYKTLCGQTTGSARTTRPSPATLNSFGKWIEKGAVVHKVSGVQVKRWAGTTQQVKSAATAKTWLTRCFGKSVIKAVTKDKSGAYLVAYAPVVNGRPFNFPR